MKKILSASSAIFSIFLFAGTVNANLITNGSFEDGKWNGNESWARLFPGSTEMTGWMIGGSGIDWHNGTQMQPTQDGKYVVDLNLDGNGITGIISQSFATTPGSRYNLTFYLSNPYNYDPSSPLLQVDIAGKTYKIEPNSNGMTPLTWIENTIPFEAVSSITTLTFSSLNGNGFWGPVIDNVSVNSVPEPSLMILGLTSLVVVSGLRKKIRK